MRFERSIARRPPGLLSPTLDSSIAALGLLPAMPVARASHWPIPSVLLLVLVQSIGGDAVLTLIGQRRTDVVDRLVMSLAVRSFLTIVLGIMLWTRFNLVLLLLG